MMNFSSIEMSLWWKRNSSEETPKAPLFVRGILNCKQEKTNFGSIQHYTKKACLNVYPSAGPWLYPDLGMERNTYMTNFLLM